jgi:prophage maintenance system killer protein
MTPLDLASLVVIAGQTLGEDTQAVLGRLDVTAAETALAEAAPAAGPDDPAACATGLLSALIRHRPLAQGNEPVAVAAMTTFLALNGWQADLEPAEGCAARITSLIAGEAADADFAAWLSKRIFRSDHPGATDSPATKAPATETPASDTPASDTPASDTPASEEPMHGWLPGRRRPARKKGLFRRFTPEAREVVIGSQEEARRLRHNYIGTEHILLGLLRERDGVAARALDALGITGEAVRQQVLGIIGEGQQQPSGHIPFTPRAKKVLELALRESVRLGHLYIGSEHILLGLVREGSGLAAQVLTGLGASGPRIRDQVLGLLATERLAPGTIAPPGIRDFDMKILQAQQGKDVAIDARDFDRAAALRDREKELMAERQQHIEQWTAGTDAAAPGREVDRLREEVQRLQDLLLQHGIEPDENGQQTA